MERAVDLRLAKTIWKAVKEYNRYRSPESTARLLEMNEDIVAIEFEGSYCETCGLNDWIIDFKYVLEDYGIQVEIIEIKGSEEDIWNTSGWRIGVFKVKAFPQAAQDGRASQLKLSSWLHPMEEAEASL